MRCRCGLALVLCWSVLCVRPAAAGLYNTEDPGPPWSGTVAPGEPPVWPTTEFEQFKYVSQQLREAVLPQSATRRLYDKRIAALEAKNRVGGLTTEDRVNLSAYYVRITDPEKNNQLQKALAVLEPVKDRGNFMVLSNLGTAHELGQQLDRALDYSERALAVWPQIWPGLSNQQLTWLYRAEKCHVALLRARLAERARQGGKGGDKVDALFPKVHFTRPDGTYAVNELGAAQLGELPDLNLLLVQQLILWRPTDFRLYWLFGELLNAQGNLTAAATVFNFLVESGYTPRELREHRAILNQARETATLVAREAGAFSVLLWALTPRGATLEPGVAALANESAPFERVYRLARLAQSAPGMSPPAEPPPASPARQSRNLLHDLRTVAVSFVAGCVVTLLVLLQFRETRRRLQGAGAAKTEA